MDEERYSNRQIERLLDQQTEVLKDYFTSALEPVITQTTKTNGRVNKLEERTDALDKRVDRFGIYVWIAGIIVSGGWALALAIIAGGHLINFHF